MQANATPQEVNLLPDGIHVRWTDGHQSYFGHRYLRSQCGCAHCIEEMTGRRLIVLADIPKDVEALDWMQVGRYALQFLWSDAHGTGFYPFKMLRELCQCDACTSDGTPAQQ